MRIVKIVGKWFIMLLLVITLILAVLVLGLGVFAKVDALLFGKLLTSSLIIIAGCIYLIGLLWEYKP